MSTSGRHGTCSTMLYRQFLICYYSLLILCFWKLTFRCVHGLDSFKFQVQEELPKGHLVGTVSAGDSIAHKYRIYNGDNQYFTLDLTSGLLRTASVIDREQLTETSIKLLVVVDDGTSGYLQVSIDITDVNDNPPQFPLPLVSLHVSESTAIGQKRTLTPAHDKDAGNNKTQRYGIVTGNELGFFRLEYTLGNLDSLFLEVNSTLDREAAPLLSFNVSACDGGTPPLCGYFILNISLTDVNDNSPVFTPQSYTASVNESTAAGTSILLVTASDADVGPNAAITYDIDRRAGSDSDRFFSIDPSTGWIVTNGGLDYEHKKSHNFVVLAKDSGSPQRTGMAYVTVTVRDENDNYPSIDVIFLITGSYQVMENATIGTVVAQVSVTDTDSGQSGKVDVWIEENDSYFVLQYKSNPGYLLKVSHLIDRESDQKLVVTVVARDRGLPQKLTRKQLSINVGDANDNPPVFIDMPPSISVLESIAAGTSLLKVNTSDRDVGINKAVRYKVTVDPIDSSAWFTIDATSGVVATGADLDREVQSQVTLKITAVDQGVPSLVAETSLIVNIVDVNDNRPVFTNSSFTGRVYENAASGTIVGQVFALDPDSQKLFGRVTFSLTVTMPFHIDPVSGVIRTLKPLDREQQYRYLFHIIATDGGNQSTQIPATVTVRDVDDNAPYFPSPLYNFSVPENLPVGAVVGFLIAIDLDAGINAEKKYSLSGNINAAVFVIDPTSGSLKLNQPLDKSVKNEYQFHAFVQGARASVSSSNRTNVIIHVLDANVSPPVFDSSVYNFTMAENNSIPHAVGAAEARRDNFGIDKHLTYSIVSVSPPGAGLFSVNTIGGISCDSIMDYEHVKAVQLVIRATDKSDASLSANTTIDIAIIDKNDNAPMFNKSMIDMNIEEGLPLGHTVLTLTAHDLDSGNGGDIMYSLIGQNIPFTIGAMSGDLMTNGTIDYEDERSFRFTVVAKDGGQPQHASHVLVHITVNDVNDNAPQFSQKDFYADISEAVDVGYSVVNISASDRDSGLNGKVHLALESSEHANYFSVDKNGIVRVKQKIDREKISEFVFQVFASDSGTPKQTSKTSVYVFIDDVNDNGPVFTANDGKYTFSLFEEKLPGTKVGMVSASDADTGSNGFVTYSLLDSSAEFQLNSMTGVISTKVQLDRELVTPLYRLIVVASDEGPIPKTASAAITINLIDTNDNMPVFSQDLPYVVALSERAVVGEHVTTVSAKDSDFASAGQVHFSLMGFNEPENKSISLFRIDPISGLLTLQSRLTHSDGWLHRFSVVASDLGVPTMLAFHKVFIYVIPYNDGLIFSKQSLEVSISESSSPGTVVTSLQVKRSERGLGKIWKYEIESGNIDSSFQLDSTSGVLAVNSPLTFLGLQSYQLKIIATEATTNAMGTLYVNILVLDNNENWPSFITNPIVGVLNENIPIGSALSTTVNATDSDHVPKPAVYYSIVSQSPGLPSFSVEPFTGVIRTIRDIDREAVAEWSLTIMAKDLACNQSKQLNSTATMRLVVLDLNDNLPQFKSKNYTYMMEDEPPGYPVMTVIATDFDEGDNAKITYSIVAGNEEAKFEINLISGEITLTEPLSHNYRQNYYLTVKATDNGMVPLSSLAKITIEVIDVNNYRPKFTNSMYSASISENLPAGSTVYKVQATDMDSGLNGLITYSMEDNSAVEIVSSSGLIVTKKSLDREARSDYILSLSAQDNSYPFRSDFATIHITVDDKNDCKPVFLSGSNVSISVLENQNALAGIHTFTASDDDVNVNAAIVYSLSSTYGSLFTLDDNSGSLSVTGPLDREAQGTYNMRVIAKNTASPFYQVEQDVTINVLDVNDNYPEFEFHEYKKTIPENTPVNTTILQLYATDRDAGLNGAVIYSLPKRKNVNGTLLGKFDVNPLTGDVYVIAPLDFEVQKVYYFLVQAWDQALHDTREKSVAVTITITDVNDNTPEFSRAVYSPLVEKAGAGDVVVKVKATDKDSGSNGKITYDFSIPSADFQLNRRNGEIQAKRQLPPANYRLSVVASDSGLTKQLSSSAIVIVTVGQSFLKVPHFLNSSLTFNLEENSVPGTILGTVVATTSPPTLVQYRLGDDKGSTAPFQINKDTGIVTVLNSNLLDYEKTHLFLFGIVAYVKGNSSLSNYISVQVNLVDVNDNVPVITPSMLDVSLPETLAGQPAVLNLYIAQFTVSDEDQGNNSRVHFEIVSGNEKGHFAIFKEDGILVAKDGLDYELQKAYTLRIKASDLGSPSLASYSIVTINVKDGNDNAPVLSQYGPLPISEFTRPGTVILIVHAFDLDQVSVIRYSLISKNGVDKYFDVNREKGEISLLQHLDYETRRQFLLTIEASDGLYSTQTTLIINVVDENDNVPQFDHPGYYFYLPEYLPKNYFIGRVNATDKDAGLYGTVRYSLSLSSTDAFIIDQSSGQIYTTKSIKLDPSSRPLQLTVTASDSGTPPEVSSATVRLRVNDPSYTGPRFGLSSYATSIPEDANIGASVGVVVATSTIPDMYILYSIKSGNQHGHFNIDARSGVVRVNGSLDREVIPIYNLIIEARDRETTPHVTSVYLNVTVLDANDHSPLFHQKSYSATVLENVTIATTLLQVHASDRDDTSTPNGRLTYHIQSGNSNHWFRINKTSGEIKVVRLLDRETLAVHRLSVKASDGGIPSRSAAVPVVINLLDVNDNAPVFSLEAPIIHLLQVDEDVVNNSVVFKAVARDEDAGSNGMISYAIIGGDGAGTFYIDRDTGWVYAMQTIDYETKQRYTLVVRASDHGVPSLQSVFEYRLAVNDKNEYTPHFLNKTYAFGVRGSASVGAVIGMVLAADEDGGVAGKMYYTFKDPADDYFKLETFTGVIVVNRDIRKNAMNRVRRSADVGQMSYIVVANNGPNTPGNEVPLTISVDYSCDGCVVPEPLLEASSGDLQGLPLILVSVFSVIVGIILLAFFLFLFAVRRRNKRAKYTGQPGADRLYQPGADANNLDDKNHHKMPSSSFRELLRPSNDDPSLYQNASTLTSSGCASTYDSRLRSGVASSGCRGQSSFIDNNSTHSFDMYQAKPALDSGIQQDLDHRMSDMTITETLTSLDSRPSRKGAGSRKGNAKAFLMESHESLHAFEEEGGGEAGGGMDVANLLYAKLADVDADEQDAIMDGTRPFQEEGALSHGGSLSTIVGSQEELRGSYNWDLMLNWRPQFKPLKAMFTELAQMKTTAMTTSSDTRTISHRKIPDSSAMMPLLPPSSRNGSGPYRTYDTQSNRTSMLSSVSSLPRSPMSIQSNYTSAAMSPSFTPAITPMVNRSPSVSPLGSPSTMLSPAASNTNSILDIAAGKERKPRGGGGGMVDLDKFTVGEVEV